MVGSKIGLGRDFEKPGNRNIRESILGFKENNIARMIKTPLLVPQKNKSATRYIT